MTETLTLIEEYGAIADVLALVGSSDTDRARSLNGVGFNRFDSPTAHALIDTPVDDWTIRDYWTAWAILRRYAKTQLPKLGVEFDALPVPPEPELDAAPDAGFSGGKRGGYQPGKYGPGWAKAAMNGNTITLGWGGSDPHFRDRLAAVKSKFNGARWNPTAKEWTVPATVQNLTALADVLGQFTGSELPFSEGEGLRDTAAAIMERQEQSLTRSLATTGETELVHMVGADRVRPFQQAGIAFARDHKKTIIADEMGLGKTMESIVTVIEAQAFPALVVCPASLKINWKKEIALWGGDDLSVQMIAGKETHHLLWAHFTIVNYDVLQAWEERLSGVAWRAVIADEAHAIKSPKAQRSVAFGNIIAATNPDYRLLLTGTPVLNRPVELWPLLDVIDGQDVFGGFFPYAKKYCAATQGRFGWDFSGASNLDELNTILRSEGLMIRRTKEDVLTELPAKQWATVSLPMQGKGFRDYERAEMQPVGVVPGDHLELLGKLRQLAWAAKSKAAFEWIDNFLESGKKLIVFGWHQEVVQAIAARYNAPTIMGGQHQRDIESGKERFQTDPECRVIACNLAAGGVGHTLTAASDVAFVEFSWNDALMDQAVSRAHRMGQRESVTGWLLRADRGDMETIDDVMIAMIAGKAEVTRTVINGTDPNRQAEILRMAREALKNEGNTEE